MRGWWTNICTVAHLIVFRFPEAIQLPGNNTSSENIDGDQQQQQNQLEKDESVSQPPLPLRWTNTHNNKQ